MKKVFFIFVILIANSVFTSCTDIDENLENEPKKIEISATEGDDQQNPDVDDDDLTEINNDGN
jgi:hypothetical protein